MPPEEPVSLPLPPGVRVVRGVVLRRVPIPGVIVVEDPGVVEDICPFTPFE